MTINKNFVVRNGLEVAESLLYADDVNNKVGINSAIPDYDLDVNGTIGITGGISIGGTTGVSGQWLESTGDSAAWKNIPVLRVVEQYTAVSGQVTFPANGFFPYASAEFIDVFVDGVKLAQDEYSTTTGNNRIELINPAFEGETIELVAYNAATVAAGYTGILGITVAEEGTTVGLSEGIKLLNFVGAYVTAIGSGAGVTIYLDDRLAQDTNYWLSNVSGLSTTTNVGINSANPTSALDVIGNVKISGIITAPTANITTGIVTNLSGTNLSYSGIGTAATLFSTTANLNRANVVTGVVTTLSGTSFNYTGVNTATTLFSTTANLNRANVVTGVVTTLSGTSFNYTGVNTATTLFSTTANLNRANVVTGVVTTLSGTSFNYTGVNTATTLFSTTSNINTGNIVTGIITNLSGTNASYSGIGTFGSLNIGTTQIVSSGRQLQNIASLDATTTATIESAIQSAPNNFNDLQITGVSTFTNGPIFVGSGTSTGTASQRLQVTGGAYISSNTGIGTTRPTSSLHVIGDTLVSGAITASSFSGNLANTLTLNTSGTGLSGSATFNNSGNATFTVTSNATSDNTNSSIVSRNATGGFSAGIITATQFSTGNGNININTTTISGPTQIIIDPAAVGDNTGSVRIRGDLFVDGTQTIINSTSIELADFNVGIATTVGTNALLDGAGIGIGSTGIRKTITWNNAAGALTSSEDWNLVSGKQYEINGTSVLSSTTLGSGVVNSSLTSVGTLNRLNVSGVSTFINANNTAIQIRSGFTTSYTALGIGRVIEEGTFAIASGPGIYANNAAAGDIVIRNNNATGKVLFTREGANASLAIDGTNVLVGSVSSTGTSAQPLQVTGGAYVSGNLGVGVTNPQDVLHVQGDLRLQADIPEIKFRSSDGTSNQYYIGANISNSVDGGLVIGEGSGIPGGTARLNIDTNGNVGIATGIPGERLHLGQGRLRLDEGWQVTWLSPTGTQRTRIAGDSGSNFIIETGASNTEALRIDSSQRVGINTSSPARPLHVNGTARLADGAALEWGGTSAYISGTSASNAILFGTSSTEAARITSNRNILIGSQTETGTSNQRLQVTGGAYVSGDVGISNTNPQRRLHLRATGADGIFLDNSDQTGNNGGPIIRVRGQRVDGNVSQSFSGQLVLEKWRMDGSVSSGHNLGAIVFGGNFDTAPGITTGMTYGASIGAIAEGTFSNINTAPTAIVFNTGTVGLGTLTFPNVTFGTEAARITSNRNLLIGATSETGTASQRLQVTGGAYVSGSVGIGTTNPVGTLMVATSGVGIANSCVLRVHHIAGSTSQSSLEFGRGTNTTFGADAFSDYRFVSSGGNFTLEHGISNTISQRVVLSETGLVGIATTVPTSTLHVQGTGLITGVTTFGSNVVPQGDATQNLGSPSNRWANVYSADIQLSNEGSTNDVDGTWGSYTIQEGENDLFLINRRNGKTYKFVLQEVI